MWHSVRLWLKVIIGFLFSVTAILVALTYALFGAREQDTVELIITEATGVGNRVVVFSGRFQPLFIHNAFWLGLAAIGFFLIFLYFIDHSFRVFLAPGVLCLVLFLFLNVMLLIAQGFVFDFAEGAAVEFIDYSMRKVRQAGYALLGLGGALIFLSYWPALRERLFENAVQRD